MPPPTTAFNAWGDELAASILRLLRAQIAAAFNEWMHRYTKDPTAFEAEFATAIEFLSQRALGRTPSYGEEAAAYLFSLIPPSAAARPETAP